MPKKLFLFFLIVAFLVSSCNKEIPDCSLQDNTYEKYSYNPDSNQCVLTSTIQKDVCGNKIIEEGETACNCPKDVDINTPNSNGGCSGSKGEFLKYYCEDKTKTCELAVTDKVEKKSSNPILRASGEFEFDSKIYYFQPFMTDRHKIKVDLYLKDIKNSESVKIKDIVLRKAYIETSSDLLGTIDLNKKFSEKFEDYSFEIPLDQFSFDTFDTSYKNIKIRLFLSYNRESYSNGKLSGVEEKTIDLKESFLDELKLINPSNKNEELEKASSGWY